LCLGSIYINDFAAEDANAPEPATYNSPSVQDVFLKTGTGHCTPDECSSTCHFLGIVAAVVADVNIVVQLKIVMEHACYPFLMANLDLYAKALVLIAVLFGC
jgi:hypothetical protein